jgi:hypothetical protein
MSAEENLRAENLPAAEAPGRATAPTEAPPAAASVPQAQADSTRRRTRFDGDAKPAVALLVGLVAVVAAIFGTLQADASKQAERATVMSARLATQVFEATAVVSQIDSFALNAQQDVIVTQLNLTAHILAALQANLDTTVLQAEDPIEQTAADRLSNVIAEMSDRSALATIPDQHTAHVLTLDYPGLTSLVEAQSQSVDLADRLGNRSTLLVYALSLVALGGVLAGLAGVLRRGGGALMALAAGFAALVVAIGVGVVAIV